MRFSHQHMADTAVQHEKLGGFASRSARNQWAESIEPLVRKHAPWPITYDVTPMQGANFSEFIYTEIAGGVWIATHSLEVTCRILDAASKQPTEGESVEKLTSMYADKYELGELPEKYASVRRCCFLPGHNLLDLASPDIIARLAHEESDVWFKPHPLTNNDALRIIAGHVGWHQLVPRDVSGAALMRQCDDIYTTTASEMSVMGFAFGKRVLNIGNFFKESIGAYHPVSRVLWAAQKRGMAQQALANMIDCQFSGLLFPWQDDVEERIQQFYAKAIEFRELYKPINSPKFQIPQKEIKHVSQ